MSHSILLVVTGGIAAYKIPSLVRSLIKKSYSVQVVLSEAAKNFVTEKTFETLTKKKVIVSEWNSDFNGIAHIDLTRSCQLVVVAPATANIINKLACGIADTFTSSLLLASKAPIMMVPAMNEMMWENKATQRAVRTLKSDGVLFAGPASGYQACGEIGLGRMIEPEEIEANIDAFFCPKAFVGKNVLVTAGPTIEPIDPVRVISNLSSGKQGFAIAREFANQGANVTLISGPVSLKTPTNVTRVNVATAQEMFEATKAQLEKCDIFVGVAAVADYRVANPHTEKWKKENLATPFEGLIFEKNPDILSYVGHLQKNRPYTVGFAAETCDIIENAKKKLFHKNASMIVANNAKKAIGAETNAIEIVTSEACISIKNADKELIAKAIINQIKKELDN